MHTQRIECHLTEESLQDELAFWKRLLHLEQWDIVARIARGNGLDLPEQVQGRCNWTISRHEALIRIMNPIDWDKGIIFPQDMEATLVHELLHLHLAPFDNFKSDTAEDNALEQAIHHLSLALVSLRRAGKVDAK